MKSFRFLYASSITKTTFPVLVISAIISLPFSALLHVAKASKSKLILVLGYTAVLSDLLFLSTIVLAILSEYGQIPLLPSWWGNLIALSIQVALLLMALTLAARV